MTTGRESLLSTRGEQLAGRALEKESRLGVEHYKPGQHEAVIYPPGEDYSTHEWEQIARLTYVDVMGHACVVVCSRSAFDAPWRPTWASRAGQHDALPAARVPDEFVLSGTMLAALAAAPTVPWPGDPEEMPL